MLVCVQDDLRLDQSWYLNGRHYSLTLEAWLRRMDAHRKEIMPIMKACRRPWPCQAVMPDNSKRSQGVMLPSCCYLCSLQLHM